MEHPTNIGRPFFAYGLFRPGQLAFFQLRELVSETAVEARDKVALVSNTIDRTHKQVAMTTDYITTKVIEPAREVAAIMAGFRRGLEVLVAPMPKPINQTYAEDEMFIG